MPNPFAAGTRPWTRITEALRAASTTVRARGELVITDSGRLLVPDGVKADKDLSPVTTAAEVAATYVAFKQAAKNPDLLVVGSITRDTNGVISTAAVVWPDGTVGTFTTNTIDPSGAINGYSITYGSPATKTYTQPTITRDTSGAATNVPQITVA